MKRYLVSLIVVIFAVCPGFSQDDVVLQDGNVAIVLQKDAEEPLRLAVETLVGDFEKVMDFRPDIVEKEVKGLTNIVIRRDKHLGEMEAHEIKVDPRRGCVYLGGSDMRGQIYAVYSFAEYILRVPPLWYYSGWEPQKFRRLSFGKAINHRWPSPQVRYRTWFPNDTDLFYPWRRLSKENDEMWLQTMLRLKLNTVELEATVGYDGNGLSREATLLKKYGLILTSHHHVAMNNNFQNWDGYWRKIRGMEPPKLRLSDEESIREFWQYSIDEVLKARQENIWQISFRGISDQPFWIAFSDAPEGDSLRAEVINHMLQTELEMIKRSTGEEHPLVRITFYDELSDMLAKGYLRPPTGRNILWTFVAARRDHYPNTDLVELDTRKTPVSLGYYMNLQFTSTGSHLAAAEGPWKMEQNYRYVASKGPLLFSVVNAGNIREHVVELAANARMMWDMKQYETDFFLADFCAQYFGAENAYAVANFFRQFYNAYWQPKQPDFPGMKRQYLFHDFRLARVIDQIGERFFRYDDNPLHDIGYERMKGRSFRIQGNCQVDTLISQLALSEKRFLRQEVDIAAFLERNPGLPNRLLFEHNLLAQCQYMHHLTASARLFVEAFKKQREGSEELRQSLTHLRQAQAVLKATEKGNFQHWYDGDRLFNFRGKFEMMERRLKEMND